MAAMIGGWVALRTIALWPTAADIERAVDLLSGAPAAAAPAPSLPHDVEGRHPSGSAATLLAACPCANPILRVRGSCFTRSRSAHRSHFPKYRPTRRGPRPSRRRSCCRRSCRQRRGTLDPALRAGGSAPGSSRAAARRRHRSAASSARLRRECERRIRSILSAASPSPGGSRHRSGGAGGRSRWASIGSRPARRSI